MAQFSFCFKTCRFCSARNGLIPFFVRIFSVRSRITSGAPFINSTQAPSQWCMVLIRFLAESNGSSPSRGISFRTASGETPARRAIDSSAVSVGSPVNTSPCTAASLSSTAPYKKYRCTGSYTLSCGGVSSRPSTNTCSTVMRFCVRVPVLSEQITDTHPRLSTAFKSLMMACSFAICWVPMACTIVTIEPSASGMAATANATANISDSRTGVPRYRLSPNTSAQIPKISAARRALNSSRLICRGVFFSCAAFIRRAIFPSSVSIPVAVTTNAPRPPVTREPAKTIFFWSPRAIPDSFSCLSPASFSRPASTVFFSLAAIAFSGPSPASPSASSAALPVTFFNLAAAAFPLAPRKRSASAHFSTARDSPVSELSFTWR